MFFIIYITFFASTYDSVEFSSPPSTSCQLVELMTDCYNPNQPSQRLVNLGQRWSKGLKEYSVRAIGEDKPLANCNYCLTVALEYAEGYLLNPGNFSKASLAEEVLFVVPVEGEPYWRVFLPSEATERPSKPVEEGKHVWRLLNCFLHLFFWRKDPTVTPIVLPSHLAQALHRPATQQLYTYHQTGCWTRLGDKEDESSSLSKLPLGLPGEVIMTPSFGGFDNRGVPPSPFKQTLILNFVKVHRSSLKWKDTEELETIEGEGFDIVEGRSNFKALGAIPVKIILEDWVNKKCKSNNILFDSFKYLGNGIFMVFFQEIGMAKLVLEKNMWYCRHSLFKAIPWGPDVHISSLKKNSEVKWMEIKGLDHTL
eukprot:Gb_19021 [translate_table: standard]